MMIDRSKISYRKAKPDDIHILVDYRIMFLKELQGKQTSSDEKKLRNELSKYFEDTVKNNTFIAWIAEYENKPIGLGGMVIQKIPGHFKIMKGSIGYVLSMFTIPTARKNGICSVILKKLSEEAKEQKLDMIYLHASDDGINLYRKFGFKEPDAPVLEMQVKNCKK